MSVSRRKFLKVGGATMALPFLHSVPEARATAPKGQLAALHKRDREQVVRLHLKHDIRTIGNWHAYDRPESENTLYTLLRHTSRTQADLNWKAMRADPTWNQTHINLLKKPERLYLNPLEFSRMQ